MNFKNLNHFVSQNYTICFVACGSQYSLYSFAFSPRICCTSDFFSRPYFGIYRLNQRLRLFQTKMPSSSGIMIMKKYDLLMPSLVMKLKTRS